ncbi:MAG: AAA family ATPase [Desulfurococcaceae archaeon TW002]
MCDCLCGLVVTVSGMPGSGKSTLARKIAEWLGLRMVSAGGLFRSLAAQKGVTLSELSRIAEEDPSIDKIVDGMSLSEASKGCVVIDAHIAGWLLKDMAHVRIYLVAPEDVRARRIAERDKKSYEEALRELRLREESEQKRFKTYYNIDIKDLSSFDLVINTASFNAEEAFEISKKAIESKLKILCR